MPIASLNAPSPPPPPVAGAAPAAAAKPAVWHMVREAVGALGGSTTNTAVRRWVQRAYPGTNHETIRCQVVAGTVNHPSRVHHGGANATPRPADDPDRDLYFRPAKGKLESYDPVVHGQWEIYRTPNGTLGVRPVTGAGATAASPPGTPQAAVADVEAPAASGGPSSKKKGNGGEVAWVGSEPTRRTTSGPTWSTCWLKRYGPAATSTRS